MSHSLYIAYGSESGNAHTLAYDLNKQLSDFSPTFNQLNDLSLETLSQLTSDDLLLVITSTTGDGDAPDNASDFYQALVANRIKKEFTLHCQYAVFGLGDPNYDNFCGFSNALDGLLKQAGAKQIAQRVDADKDFDDFFDIWSQAIEDYLNKEDNADQALAELLLQIDPDDF